MFYNDLTSNFTCDCCGYTTNRKSDYTKHLLTRKHKKVERKLNFTYQNKLKNKDKNLDKMNYNISQLICECGKIYSTRQSLHVHQKKCNTNPNLILELIKDNRELREVLVEQNKTIQEMSKNNTLILASTTHNHNNIVQNNRNTFNLNFFLNEQCKNAINMSDFVNSIEFDLDDLEETGRVGFVEGISKVVIKNLADLDTNLRPIHCGDIKREVLYIKNEGKWEKEQPNRNCIKSAIQEIANKNIKKISDWIKCHPDCQNSESSQNEKYLNIVLNSMSGSTIEEQQSNYDKIISRVAREVIIKKNV